MATETPKPTVTDHDAITGETVVRPMTTDELAQAAQDEANTPDPPA